MPTIHFEPDGKQIEARGSETILAASLRAGIPHAHACGGKARCSTCRISVEEGLDFCGPRAKSERELAKRLRFSPQVRLGCQTKISGDIKVRRLVIDDDDIEFTRRIAEGKKPASIGEEKEVAILFADIRGFTSISETLPPYDVVYMLNRYFQIVGQVISRHGGRINNYMGDGLMALFGHDDEPDAAFRAISAGLAMIDEVWRGSRHFEALYGLSFRIGVGVHYGEVVIGTIGAIGGQHLTAIGDAVNFASRIESANKNYGTEMLISENVHAQVVHRITVGKRIDDVVVKGKSRQHVLYEVTGLANHEEGQTRAGSHRSHGGES